MKVPFRVLKSCFALFHSLSIVLSGMPPVPCLFCCRCSETMRFNAENRINKCFLVPCLRRRAFQLGANKSWCLEFSHRLRSPEKKRISKTQAINRSPDHPPPAGRTEPRQSAFSRLFLKFGRSEWNCKSSHLATRSGHAVDQRRSKGPRE